jgi:Fe-S-cluster-containing hydrogenase component 2/CRP-like cAMP-binding protein/thioredoxin reductase
VAERLDVVIVGSGPAGIAAGVRAAQRKLSHVVLERAQLANTVRRYRSGKHVMAEPSRLPLHRDCGVWFEAASREQVLESWMRDCERAGVQLRCGAEFELVALRGSRGEFELELAGGQRLRCAALILAIGTTGNLRSFEAPGRDLPHIVYELDGGSSQPVNQSIAIVGAGDSAIEDALALCAENDVVLVQRKEGFTRARAANRLAIETALRAGHLRQYTHTSVSLFDRGGVLLRSGEREVWLECDLVLGRLGASPPRAFLESVGVRFVSDHAEARPAVSGTFESSVPGLYVVGSLLGADLIKPCINQGYEAVEHLVGAAVVSAHEPLLRQSLAPIADSVSGALERVRRSVPLFAELGRGELEELLCASTLRVADAGELLHTAGDYGDTLLTVLEGTVQLGADELDGAGTEGEERRLDRGAFFGEESLLSGRQRERTAVAATPSLLLESSAAALRKAFRAAPAVRAALEGAWLDRKLAQLLPMLAAQERVRLAEQAQLLTLVAGQALFREGDPAAALYFVRRGSLAVSRHRSGSDRVVGHVSSGHPIGEFALLAPERTRRASATASVETEVVGLPIEAFLALTEHHAALGEQIERSWREKLARHELLLEEPGLSRVLGFVMARGGKEAVDLLVIDEALCIRCDNCEVACATTHGGVARIHREAGSRLAGLHLATACQHCENAPCMTDCPPAALQRDPAGEIYVNDSCIGCGNCVSYCPYGAIQMAVLSGSTRRSPLWQILFGQRRRAPRAGAHEVAVKCDLCRELLADNPAGLPACVASCPTGAISRAEPIELLERLMLDAGRFTLEEQPVATPPETRVKLPRGATLAPEDVELDPETAFDLAQRRELAEHLRGAIQLLIQRREERGPSRK